MKIFVGVSLFLVAAASIQAQTPAPQPAPRALVELSSTSESTVKGSPFSAEAVSESVQTLADGNRIVRKWTTKLYRNSQGQFRREGAGLPGATFGAFAAGGDSAVTVMDPVGGFRFFFDTGAKTARVFTLRSSIAKLREKAPIIVEGNQNSEKIQAELNSAGAARIKIVPAEPGSGTSVATAMISGMPALKFETKTESLGTQNFEGIDAEGTRTVTTIPANAIGNELPLEIVYEKWYSKELHTIVYSKHSDPRFGEQTYRLTNINRSEPDPSLFEVPDGYKVVTTPGAVYKQQSRMKQPPLQTRTAARTVQVKNATSTASRP